MEPKACHVGGRPSVELNILQRPPPGSEEPPKQVRYRIVQLGPATNDDQVVRPLLASLGRQVLSFMLELAARGVRDKMAAEGREIDDKLLDAIALTSVYDELQHGFSLEVGSMPFRELTTVFAPLFDGLKSAEMRRIRNAILLGAGKSDSGLSVRQDGGWCRFTLASHLDDCLPDAEHLYRLFVAGLVLNVGPILRALGMFLKLGQAKGS